MRSEPPHVDSDNSRQHSLRWLHFGRFIFCLALACLCGCARFQPKEISVEKSAEDFDARGLSGESLREFLARGQTTVEWPLKQWDLDSLTLAAFYFHPDLEVARARWRGASASQITAGERPNPSVSWSPT